MARPALLETRVSTYAELIGNGRSYHVPLYQRDYSWSEEAWEDLWHDVVELRQSEAEPHYMGAVVVSAESDRKLQVIDGQQRFATLSLLALAVIDRLNRLAADGVDAERNRARAKELRNRYIGERDPASLTETSRLFLNETDDGFYQDYLVELREPPNLRGRPKSNQLLSKCLRYFSKRLDELDEVAGSGEELAALMSDAVARRLLFIVITVDDDLKAYTVFETLNARGLELTTTDLLRNYIFSRAPTEADRTNMLRRWRRITDAVDAPRVPDLLRYHMLCESPKVRKRRLFKEIRDRYRTAQDVSGLIETLDGRAEVFSAARDPDHSLWIDFPVARDHVRELSLFGTTQMMPLLFTSWEKWRHERPRDFVRVLKLVATIAFRYTVVSRLNASALERIYHGAAKAVADGVAESPKDVFEYLREAYVQDERMLNDFTYLSIGARGRKRRLAHYVLSKLERDAKGHDNETATGTIEHIYPENPGSEWDEDFPLPQRDNLIDRLGNLTLLEPNLNRRIGNSSYSDKVDAYQRSRFAITRAIAETDVEEWTPDAIQRRQERLAKKAVHIWRAGFA